MRVAIEDVRPVIPDHSLACQVRDDNKDLDAVIENILAETARNTNPSNRSHCPSPEIEYRALLLTYVRCSVRWCLEHVSDDNTKHSSGAVWSV